MKRVITPGDNLLSVSKKIAAKEGIKSINIRGVAKEANISVGSVYNYFENKEELINATIVDIWGDIFHGAGECRNLDSFHDCIVWLISMINKCCTEYPDILDSHPHSFDEKQESEKGQRIMEQYFAHIHKNLKKVLESDKKVREGVFSDSFTKDEFIRFAFSNIIYSAKSDDKNYLTLIKLIDKLLYE